MTYRVAINGFGRIGRCVLRAIYERRYRGFFQVIAVNDVTDLRSREHLSRYDSVHGRFPFKVRLEGDNIVIGDDSIRHFSEPEIGNLQWGGMGIDLVIETTGLCQTRSRAEGHLNAGAARLLLSYPGPGDVDRTVVYGVNHKDIKPGDRIISNASCTSNCLVPVLKVIDDAYAIQKGMVTTVHSVMNDQALADSSRGGDLRKSRSALRSIVPIGTHLAAGVQRVMPHLRGRLEANALRVPVINISGMDITLIVERETSYGDVNGAIEEAGEKGLKNIIGLDRKSLVSCDFRHDSRSAVVDSEVTKVVGGNMIKLFAWFDNEWAYAVRMCDTALAILEAGA